MSLGEYLRKARLAKDGLTPRGLARLAKFSAACISDCELDRRRPTHTVLAILSLHIDIDLSECERLAGRVPKDIADWLLAEPGRFDAMRRKMMGVRP